MFFYYYLKTNNNEHEGEKLTWRRPISFSSICTLTSCRRFPYKSRLPAGGDLGLMIPIDDVEEKDEDELNPPSSVVSAPSRFVTYCWGCHIFFSNGGGEDEDEDINTVGVRGVYFKRYDSTEVWPKSWQKRHWWRERKHCNCLQKTHVIVDSWHRLCVSAPLRHLIPFFC